MPDKHLFEYAVIRVVPKVEREEFINVGVILYSKKARYLKVKYQLNSIKLQVLCATTDCTEVETYLQSFERICNASPDGGPIARLDLPSRFRWLTATRSTIIQSSKVHPGFTEDLDQALERLFEQLVA